MLFASTLGGGIREHIFWKNYFFHCAYTRYEAGLSIDEIWSEALQLGLDSKIVNNKNTPSSLPIPVLPTTTNTQDEGEETITFAAEIINPQVQIEPNGATITTTELFGNEGAVTTQPKIRSESEYEMIDDDKLLFDTSLNNADNSDGPVLATDYELDELEAEIARELLED